jgi:hypothetical protein
VNYPQWLDPRSEHILYLYFRKYAISRPKVWRTKRKTLNALVRYVMTVTALETVVMNSWSQRVGGLKRLLPKETRSRQWCISEESRETGFKTSYVSSFGFQDCGM